MQNFLQKYPLLFFLKGATPYRLAPNHLNTVRNIGACHKPMGSLQWERERSKNQKEDGPMPLEVDARGLPCPQPVILTRNAMREAEEVITLVSAQDQVANVRRLAEKAGWRVHVEARGEAFAIHITKPQAAPQAQLTPAESAPSPAPGRRVVVISSDRMGRGEDELGLILMRSFLYALGEVEPVPQTMIFFNTGVKLTAEGSPVLEELAALQARGVEILVCGTCLDYFGLKDRVQVGTISNMYTIAETLLAAGHTITV